MHLTPRVSQPTSLFWGLCAQMMQDRYHESFELLGGVIGVRIICGFLKSFVKALIKGCVLAHSC